ncbi:MAG: superoxide dismutase [Candidatus Diapherotrites archaeon]
MPFALPKLNYDFNALEPYIDEQTMRIHYGKHHQAYIDKLNAAILNTKFEKMPIEDILKDLEKVPAEIRQTIRNNGGGHYNHSLFWELMSPKGGKLTSTIQKALENTFGSFESFKEKFKNAGLNQFGSGWAWLVVSDKKLEIISTPNQDNPISQNKTPILGVDVWEHAYYLKYQNRRADYLEQFFNVINWEKVEELYKKALK